ncbi:hypothetical protein EB796_020869 [Bugula neritina]|uniref:Uncharacterized protein n=1 Tax=Bugula neritina TaxID=10212 RepID=A0A7J7J3T3_BUGNE|nr:hypothetical protein EB796_020869 [Bugula neritina]
MKVIAILLAVCLALTSATYYNNYLYGGYGLSNYKYYNRGLYNRGLYSNYRHFNFGKGYNLYPSKISSYYGRY